MIQKRKGILFMIKLGILGAGGIARMMVRTVKGMNDSGDDSVLLYGIGSRDIKKAEEFARENDIPKFYGSYEDLVSDEDIDLIYIASPHSHHYEHIKLCLEHGKNVLCEKAFTINAEMAKEVCRIAEEKGLVLAEAIWPRYQPSRKLINDIVAKGLIGEPKIVTANLAYDIDEVPRLVRKELAGGALLDVGVYTINFAEMIFGHPDRIKAQCSYAPTGVDETTSLLFEYDDGRRTILYSSTLGLSDRFGYVYGTEGFIQVENINNPQCVRVFKDYEVIEEIPVEPQITGYEYEVREVARCIENGIKEAPSMPHSETIKVLEEMDEIRAQLGITYPFE